MHRLALVSLGFLVVAGCRKPAPPPDPERTVAPQKEEAAPETHRCAPAGNAAPFVLASTEGRGRADSDGGDPLDNLLPFATEAGEGVTWAGGFALGAIHVQRDVPTLAVVTMGPDGQGASVLPLGAAHGDVQPPRVAALGKGLLFGVLEPQPNGRALRIGRIEAGQVSWGAEFRSPAGESQAFDLAVGEKKVVVAWDEEQPEASGVQIATLDAANLATATPARKITPDGRDADSPRIVPRPGGFWLAYVARRGAVDTDAGYAAEEIGFRWLEVMPLDANGSPTSKPRSVSPSDGHVMLYDIAPGPDGGALLVWRDEDTSSGSGGGRVMKAVVRPAQPEPPSVLVESEVGSGAPNLLGHWLALANAAGATLLAPISATGEVLAAPGAEPEIGEGEPIAAAGDALLVVRPVGRDMRLQVLRCRSEDADAGAVQPAAAQPSARP